MVPFINENPEKEAGLLLVADLRTPGKLINAKSAYYLISLSIPSPMGAFLCFSSTLKEEAKSIKNLVKLFTKN
ncbi:MAG: hypothetical protein R2784_01570 [Saprospiraceae bacterium]